MPTLLTNADIWTMDARMPRAEAAIIAEDGRFAYVGTEAGARLLLAEKPFAVRDAGGRTVWPGLNDTHLHVAGCALRARCVSLAGAGSIAQAQARMRAGLFRVTNMMTKLVFFYFECHV